MSNLKRAYKRANRAYFIASLLFVPAVVLACWSTYRQDRGIVFWSGVTSLTLSLILGGVRLEKARDEYVADLAKRGGAL